jgi:hypothetical protein
MIAIDVGCARYGGDYSIERLIEEFHPDIIYGFDPNQGPDEYPWPSTGAISNVHIEKKAVWIFDGEIGFVGQGLGGHATQEAAAPRVPCFDLAAFIRSLPSDEEIVLKIDAEGAEYELLEHLIQTRTDELLKFAWVEWHPPGARVNSWPDKRRTAIEESISCEMHQWNW